MLFDRCGCGKIQIQHTGTGKDRLHDPFKRRGTSRNSHETIQGPKHKDSTFSKTGFQTRYVVCYSCWAPCARTESNRIPLPGRVGGRAHFVEGSLNEGKEDSCGESTLEGVGGASHAADQREGHPGSKRCYHSATPHPCQARLLKPLSDSIFQETETYLCTCEPPGERLPPGRPG